MQRYIMTVNGVNEWKTNTLEIGKLENAEIERKIRGVEDFLVKKVPQLKECKICTYIS